MYVLSDALVRIADSTFVCVCCAVSVHLCWSTVWAGRALGKSLRPAQLSFSHLPTIYEGVALSAASTAVLPYVNKCDYFVYSNCITCSTHCEQAAAIHRVGTRAVSPFHVHFFLYSHGLSISLLLLFAQQPGFSEAVDRYLVTYQLVRDAQDGTALVRFSALLDAASQQLRQLLRAAQWSDLAIDRLIADLRAKAASRSNSSTSTSSSNNCNANNSSHNHSSSSTAAVPSASAAAAAVAAAAGASHSPPPRRRGLLDSGAGAAGHQSRELPPWNTLQVCTQWSTLLNTTVHCHLECYTVSSLSLSTQQSTTL
jgi:hypothetical protein